jgi:pimeloyl-ACP methyl ester carboxylesterase
MANFKQREIFFMLIALEGSSPTIRGENNRKYYVWTAYQTTKQSPKIYVPGPAAVSWGLSGINIRTMSDQATSLITSNSGPIFLVGWSRGAAACVQVALDLKRAGFNRNIEALFLFDPVDQDGSTGDFLNLVPSNVTNCYRARATDKGGINGILFPTCANNHEAGVNYVTADFNTSHGGIAGTEGAAGDKGSKAWMWGHMARHGVV